MYSLLADTSTQDLLIVLLKDEKCLDFIYVENLLKKTDVFPGYIEKLLSKNKIKIKDISTFYCTNGPGSFTGSRTALIFFKTVVQITKAKLFTTSSIEFIANSTYEGDVVVDAKSGLSFVGRVNKKKLINKIEMKKFSTKVTKFDIEDFKKNTKVYLSTFREEKNVFSTDVFYIKEPSIGEVK